jgi:hypothetical protein
VPRQTDKIDLLTLRQKYFPFYFKTTLKVLTLFLLASCNNKTDCPQFNYQKFGVDTNLFKKDLIFVSNYDTIVFKTKELAVDKKNYSEPSFFDADECRNGFLTTYYSKEINFELTYYLMQYDDWNMFSLMSINFSKDIKNINSLNDINLVIDVSDLMNPPSFIKQLTIKQGYIDNFLDSNKTRWTRAKIEN